MRCLQKKPSTHNHPVPEAANRHLHGGANSTHCFQSWFCLYQLISLSPRLMTAQKRRRGKGRKGTPPAVLIPTIVLHQQVGVTGPRPRLFHMIAETSPASISSATPLSTVSAHTHTSMTSQPSTLQSASMGGLFFLTSVHTCIAVCSPANRCREQAAAMTAFIFARLAALRSHCTNRGATAVTALWVLGPRHHRRSNSKQDC